MESQPHPVSAEPRPAAVDAAAEWRARLTGIIGALLLFESAGGLAIYLLPFGLFAQVSVLLHTLVGVVTLPPLLLFLLRHWRVRRRGQLSHYQLLGYLALALLAAATVSGLVLTLQGVTGPAIGYGWDLLHIVTGLGCTLVLLVHLLSVIVTKGAGQQAEAVAAARASFYRWSLGGCALLLVVTGGWAALAEAPVSSRPFVADYNWRFGEDRPFAPSLARLDHAAWRDGVIAAVAELVGEPGRVAFEGAIERTRGQPVGLFAEVRSALAGLGLGPGETERLERIIADAAGRLKAEGSTTPRALAGSAGCGRAGCHQQIYQEWLPSAHRYSSLDHMFQRVQGLMVEETAPEYTRYCAGCHDPISLFSGAKNPGNITLSAEGSNEGISCVVCHSIVQTDVQGNGDYTLRTPEPYLYEWAEGGPARLAGDFLIRAYPWRHRASYERPLYRRAEFCGACHKQYVDREVNIDIGKVQGQNQYDSWKNSRWVHADDPRRTVGCRECHMPLQASEDPARGDGLDYNRSPDDQAHRSHRMLGGNQYIPVDQGLEGAAEHVALVERWLRGELEIPEIADKWTEGPVVRVGIAAPAEVRPGEEVRLQVSLTNNKTGHDFPTGPLDMIESWIELEVTDGAGNPVFRQGGMDPAGQVEGAPLIFKADGFDRRGGLIDRHNLWDLVGMSYKRALYPGVTDSVEAGFQCPSLSRPRLMGPRQPPGARDEPFAFPAPAADGELVARATLWYRKANPQFLDRIYGAEPPLRSPLTEIAHAETRIRVVAEGPDGD